VLLHLCTHMCGLVLLFKDLLVSFELLDCHMHAHLECVASQITDVAIVRYPCGVAVCDD